MISLSIYLGNVVIRPNRLKTATLNKSLKRINVRSTSNESNILEVHNVCFQPEFGGKTLNCVDEQPAYPFLNIICTILMKGAIKNYIYYLSEIK